jgi:hypothetical protein
MPAALPASCAWRQQRASCQADRLSTPAPGCSHPRCIDLALPDLSVKVPKLPTFNLKMPNMTLPSAKVRGHQKPRP